MSPLAMTEDRLLAWTRRTFTSLLLLVIIVTFEMLARRMRGFDLVSLGAALVLLGFVDRRWRTTLPGARAVWGVWLATVCVLGLGLRCHAIEFACITVSLACLATAATLNRLGTPAGTNLLIGAAAFLLCLSVAETSLRVASELSRPYRHDMRGRVFEDGDHMWRTIPRTKQRHRLIAADGSVEFDAMYRIERDGARRTLPEVEDGARWCLFGGSYTFGLGVADDATLAAFLQQRHPTRRVSNHGVAGFGTSEIMRRMQEVLDHQDDIELCVLVMIEDHFRRTACPDHLTGSWGPRKPRYRLDGDDLIFVGPADRTLGALSTINVNLLRRSSLFEMLPINGWTLDRPILDLNLRILEKMKTMCESASSTATTIAFAVILIPTADSTVTMGGDVVLTGVGSAGAQDLDTWIAGLATRGIPLLDLRERFFAEFRGSGRPASDYFYLDAHPRPAYNALIARWADPFLTELVADR